MILGIDVSKWQGDMDWAKAASAGVQFAYLRAAYTGTSGTTTMDEQWLNNIAEAPKWFPCGAYYYFLPQFDAIMHADYFISVIRSAPLWLPPVIDVEQDGGLTPIAVKTKVKTFIYRVKEVMAHYCMIYTRSSFWNPMVADSELWEELDLWIARYSNTMATPWVGTTLKPRDWSTWQFLAVERGF